MSYSTHDIKAWLAREISHADDPQLWFWYFLDAVEELRQDIDAVGLEPALRQYLPTTYDWPPKEEE